MTCSRAGPDGLAFAYAPVFWKLSEQCLFFAACALVPLSVLLTVVPSGRNLVVPFAGGDPLVPHRCLAWERPALVLESLVDAGRFDLAAAYSVSRKLYRSETAYRVLARLRSTGCSDGVRVPGGYKASKSAGTVP